MSGLIEELRYARSLPLDAEERAKRSEGGGAGGPTPPAGIGRAECAERRDGDIPVTISRAAVHAALRPSGPTETGGPSGDEPRELPLLHPASLSLDSPTPRRNVPVTRELRTASSVPSTSHRIQKGVSLTRFTILLSLVLSAALIPALAVAKPAKPPKADLSIAAAPSTTTYRQATVISGKLKGADKAGKTVTLRGDQYPFKGDKVAGTTVTDSTGAYSFTRRPTRNTLYRTTVGSKRSPVVQVLVRFRLSLRVSDTTPRSGQRIRVKGRVCPSHDGLRVSLQRRAANGAFVTVRRTRLRAAKRCSVYSRRVRIGQDGTYRVTADDRAHERGFSAVVAIDAHN
jgi:hypothetical protein